MTSYIYQPWPWWLSGVFIAGIMFTLLYFGKSFGFSSNLRTICTMAGAGKHTSFFNFNWKSQSWNLMFLIGAIIGGYITSTFMTADATVLISDATITELAELGFAAPNGMQPQELFDTNAIFSLKGFSILAIGGFMVGFGARYAGGCTSGHAISGISNLQLPSLLAVVGFFIGGLTMTYLLFPIIF